MTDRLEDALATYLTYDADTETVAEFLARHEDLRDLLEPMFADASEPDGETVHAGAAPGGDVAPQVLGDFRILRELGRGGMGVVFEARQLSLERRVALKVLPAHMTLQPAAIARFKREALTAARLEHDNIVEILAVGSDDGHHFFAMELVEGKPLDEHFAQTDADPRAVVSCIASVCDALQVAHDAGVLHRDVKPSNVLLTAAGKVKLTDFGLAREQGLPAMTATGEFAGTPHYVSPEQATGASDLDARTDVFSLGATLFELVTGTRPFHGRTSQEVLSNILVREPRDPVELNPRLAQDLSAIVLKALEKDPGRRYASAGAFAHDLRAFLDGRPVSARRVTRVGRAVRWSRRNPVVAWLAALLLLTALVGATWILTQNARLRGTLDELMQLADIQLIRRANADRLELRVASAQDEQRLAAWLEQAQPLRERGVEHRRRLAALRAKAAPMTPAELEAEWQKHPDHPRLVKLRKQYALGAAKMKGFYAEPPSPARDERIRRGEHFQPRLAKWVEETAAVVEQRRTYVLSDSTEQWIHDNLADLVRELEEFDVPERGTYALAEKWYAFAQRARAMLGSDAWPTAIDAIATSPKYGGLRIVPQFGLVPLGADPKSGLHEFAYPLSGDVPERDEKGKIVPKEGMAIVFVLCPGGTFHMGAERPVEGQPHGQANRDREAAEAEGPIRELTLEPYFLSKYEMTQGQWYRLLGRKPSYNRMGRFSFGRWNTGLMPVDTISWVRATAGLKVFGLTLPSEAQWEYAARAGTRSPFYVPAAQLDAKVGNLADKALARHVSSERGNYVNWNLDDGFGGPAHVGSFRPNPFGFHDLIGNVAEWCADIYAPYGKAGESDGENRVLRGACFVDKFRMARSSARLPYRKDDQTSEFGFRAARPLHR